MPAIRRLSDLPYRWDIIAAPRSEVANQEKLLPAAAVNAEIKDLFAAGVSRGIQRHSCRFHLSKSGEGVAGP